MIRSATLLALGSALFLAACSGGPDAYSSRASQFKIYRDAFKVALAPKREPTVLTPAYVANLPVSAIEVVVEDRDATALVAPYFDRTDGRPGAIRTWRTGNDSQIVLRDGVLIATRGLGNDLSSSRVSSVVKSVRTRNPVSGPHNLFVLGHDNQTTRIDLECDMQSLGQKTIEIVQMSHNVLHFQENCTGPQGPVTNDYWIDRYDSTIWQSRQWGGPFLGYLRMRLLKQ